MDSDLPGRIEGDRPPKRSRPPPCRPPVAGSNYVTRDENEQLKRLPADRHIQCTAQMLQRHTNSRVEDEEDPADHVRKIVTTRRRRARLGDEIDQ